MMDCSLVLWGGGGRGWEVEGIRGMRGGGKEAREEGECNMVA